MRQMNNYLMPLSIIVGITLFILAGCAAPEKQESDEETTGEPIFKISLAEWSINPIIYDHYIQENGYGKFWERMRNYPEDDFAEVAAQRNLEFPQIAKDLGIDAIEYVNSCFYYKANDMEYLRELKARGEKLGVKSLLIMVDGEGRLGDPDEEKRTQAIENHYKWIDAAQFLGCHSIRVNAASEGPFEEQQRLAADGLSRLGEYAAGKNINVLVENHGGLSSNGEWLAGVMEMVNMDNVGTLPDFGNFRISYDPEEWYDRYKGVKELMPYAKAVSAKAQEFDENGNEVNTDYFKIMKIVLDAGYRGYVGIEYEGEQMSSKEGIRATKDLLLRVREEYQDDYD